MRISFLLNGRPMEMEVQGERRLLDFLREDLHLTGTKEGCGEGECGACTVILDGKAVHACLTTVGELDNSQLLTIEGLEQNGELDRLQKAFIKKSAVQCGFCTSGMIMSAKALLMENPHPTQEEIKRAIAGNICRCSGYKEIKAAIALAAEEE
ncbi:MAG TPA: (2Fe-2S)-binding protein [Candidatus Blautia pullicola]|jgi:aerobic-type carbon monoxide dehydrogenase small subunit (CoxS/CutS family)|uniref:(2Fe-2S)-binding protein n=1 Tax=Candidatus Blautia pullicola TaxID=2838498 RepID=A0A9D2FQ16_9FIRM|nr:(2Fe-2S)-binding protein [Candidatus Blautia pullicola]